MSLVLDSSITLAWIYDDETTDAVRQVFEIVGRDGAWVPALWRLEVANALTIGIRRGRIDAGFRDSALADLAVLEIETDPSAERPAWTTTLRLADRFRLTLYDAAYLELAERRSLPLATLDTELCGAAERLGIRSLGRP